MSPITSQPYGETHPLGALESWPKSGPVYGIGEEKDEARRQNFWERVTERIRRSPVDDDFDAGQARIWY
jgi:hypothetical protein